MKLLAVMSVNSADIILLLGPIEKLQKHAQSFAISDSVLASRRSSDEVGKIAGLGSGSYSTSSVLCSRLPVFAIPRAPTNRPLVLLAGPQTRALSCSLFRAPSWCNPQTGEEIGGRKKERRRRRRGSNELEISGNFSSKREMERSRWKRLRGGRESSLISYCAHQRHRRSLQKCCWLK